jgi:uncharacterized protein (DUF1697 family)
MTAMVALLRAVNLPGHGKVSMARLGGIAADLGLGESRTYLQSGNLVFTAPQSRRSRIGGDLEDAIAGEFGHRVRVVLRDRDQMARIAARNPYLDSGIEPKLLHVVFLAATPAVGAAEALDPDRSPGDEFTVDGTEIYVRYPNGSGRSKLTLDWFERGLGAVGTARTWNTVVNLLAMMDA